MVPGADDRDNLWDLEDGEEAWGFAPRNPTPGERLKSYGLLWQKSLPAIVIDGLVGIACAMTALAMLRLGKAKPTRTVEKAAAILAILGLIGGGLFLVLISGFFSYLGGLSIAMWLLSLGLGAGAVLLGSKAAGALRGPAESGTNRGRENGPQEVRHAERAAHADDRAFRNSRLQAANRPNTTFVSP